jgi:hypothetical protein
VINGTPKLVSFPIYFHKHLIQMPLPVGVRTHISDAITPDLSSEHRAKPIPPETYRFVTHIDAALMQ